MRNRQAYVDLAEDRRVVVTKVCSASQQGRGISLQLHVCIPNTVNLQEAMRSAEAPVEQLGWDRPLDSVPRRRLQEIAPTGCPLFRKFARTW